MQTVPYGQEQSRIEKTTFRSHLLLTLFEKQAKWIVYVTDAGQASHFELIFAAAKYAGWVDAATRIDHVPFGLVCGPDGKKYKTRSGDVVRLVDLLDEAVSQR